MKHAKKVILNTMIILYLGIIYFSGVPESNTLNSRIKEKSLVAAFALGIWPSWSMFAPNPIRFDSKSYVEVTHKNGEVRVHDVEIKLTGALATFRKARWMKYSQDNLRSPNQRALLRPALRHFIFKYDEVNNPIVHVQIKRKWSEVHPYSEKLHSIGNTPRTEKNEILLTQQVGP